MATIGHLIVKKNEDKKTWGTKKDIENENTWLCIIRHITILFVFAFLIISFIWQNSSLFIIIMGFFKN